MRPVLTVFFAAQLYVGLVDGAHCDQPASAAPPNFALHSLSCPEALLRGCCSVYCPKPQPYIRCFYRDCATGDYCRKSCPCVPCFSGCWPDCYFRKPFPELCRPIAADYFRCAESSAPYDSSDACVSTAPLSTAPAAATVSPAEGADISSVFPASN
jgi:hypothetical protein